MKFSEGQASLHLFVSRLSASPFGIGVPRSVRVRLNRFRTGVERFRSFTHEWGLAPTSICECGALDQTVAHLILECPLHRAPIGYLDCWSRMTRLNAGSTTSLPTFEENLI